MGGMKFTGKEITVIASHMGGECRVEPFKACEYCFVFKQVSKALILKNHPYPHDELHELNNKQKYDIYLEICDRIPAYYGNSFKEERTFFRKRVAREYRTVFGVNRVA